jgi:lipopolysaccharide export system permease protein
MQIIDRYVLKGFIQSLIYCILAFILLYIIVDLFNYIDEMMRNNIPAETILLYYVMLAPTIFVQIAPMAALLATIYALSNLKRYNELIAMRASGISLWQILRPLLFATALLSLVVFIVNDKIVPESMPISSTIREDEIRDMDKKDKVVFKDIAVFLTGNRILYARSFNIKEKELKDIILHQNDDEQTLVMKLSAERGFWKERKWIFENGTTYRMNKAGYIIGTPMPFRRKVMDIKEKPYYFAQKGGLPEFMNYKQLRSYIKKFAIKNSSTTRNLLVDLHYKTALPFVSLAVLLVASPFAFMMQKGGILVGVGISILVGIVFFGIQGISLAMGKAGVFPPFISAWLANILYVGSGIYLMNRCP